MAWLGSDVATMQTLVAKDSNEKADPAQKRSKIPDCDICVTSQFDHFTRHVRDLGMQSSILPTMVLMGTRTFVQ